MVYILEFTNYIVALFINSVSHIISVIKSFLGVNTIAFNSRKPQNNHSSLR